MKTAHQTYTERRKAIDAKIAKLQSALRTLDAVESDDQRNWGFAGSAGHISEKLDELIEHITAKKTKFFNRAALRQTGGRHHHPSDDHSPINHRKTS